MRTDQLTAASHADSESRTKGCNEESGIEDSALLARIRLGDEQAMAFLYDRYSTLVYSIALRVVHCPDLAEDVLECVFMQVWRTPDEFGGVSSSLRNWLLFASRTRAIDLLRGRRPSDLMDLLRLDLSVGAPNPDPTDSQEKARTLLAKLPTEERRVLDMAFFEGLTPSELAAKEKCPPDVVKKWLCSALSALRKAPANEDANFSSLRETGSAGSHIEMVNGRTHRLV